MFKHRDQFILSGTVRNNQNSGEWIYYYPDGKIESKGEFIKDKLTGKWTWYYENGSVKQVGFFINGEREGNWVMFNKDGVIQSQITYQNGNMASIINAERKISI